jgi:hypothetical protein
MRVYLHVSTFRKVLFETVNELGTVNILVDEAKFFLFLPTGDQVGLTYHTALGFETKPRVVHRAQLSTSPERAAHATFYAINVGEGAFTVNCQNIPGSALSVFEGLT